MAITLWVTENHSVGYQPNARVMPKEGNHEREMTCMSIGCCASSVCGCCSNCQLLYLPKDTFKGKATRHTRQTSVSNDSQRARFVLDYNHLGSYMASIPCFDRFRPTCGARSGINRKRKELKLGFPSPDPHVKSRDPLFTRDNARVRFCLGLGGILFQHF